jgi:putative phosphoesterase
MFRLETKKKMLVGVISDTHGLLRPEVTQAFKKVDLILHAGDIGAAEVLEELKSIAPVIAVRGNNDKGRWARAIRETEVTEIAGIRIYVLHDLKEINFDPAHRRFQAVVSGHSHRPLIERRNEILFVNPGSAGPRRFKLPITVARLTLDSSLVNGEIIMLSR